MPAADFAAILKVLCARGVDFIVVGGVSAVLNGAPISTFDLDVVHSRDAANVARLTAALDELDAIYRLQRSRRLRPNASHLGSPGHNLLETKFGNCDFLGVIGEGEDYATLKPHTIQMEVAPGVNVLVLDLETLIRVKESTAGEKDRATLPILRRTLEERNRMI